MNAGTDAEADARVALAGHLSSDHAMVGELADADRFEMLVEYFAHLKHSEPPGHEHGEGHPWLQRVAPVVCRLRGAPLEWDGAVVVWRDERDEAGECQEAVVAPGLGIGLHEPTVSKGVAAGRLRRRR